MSHLLQDSGQLQCNRESSNEVAVKHDEHSMQSWCFPQELKILSRTPCYQLKLRKCTAPCMGVQIYLLRAKRWIYRTSQHTDGPQGHLFIEQYTLLTLQKYTHGLWPVTTTRHVWTSTQHPILYRIADGTVCVQQLRFYWDMARVTGTLGLCRTYGSPCGSFHPT